MKRHVVIYIFGLSDHRARGQTLAVSTWQLYGFAPEVFHMYWHSPGRFADKLSKLISRIETLTKQGHDVSLVGVSAGASTAIAAYAARPESIRTVICICGKLRNPETIHPRTYRNNPAFRESMDQLKSNLAKLDMPHRSRVLSIRPLADRLVPPDDTLIPGAHNKRIYTLGHAFTIGFCVFLYAPFLLRFARRH